MPMGGRRRIGRCRVVNAAVEFPRDLGVQLSGTFAAWLVSPFVGYFAGTRWTRISRSWTTETSELGWLSAVS